MSSSLRVCLAWLLCLGVAGSVSGCAQTSKKKPGRPVTRQKATPGGVQGSFEVQFEDVPVPARLKLVDQESFLVNKGSAAATHGQIRSLAATYSGRADVSDLVEFFMDEMPKRKWEFISRQSWGKTTHIDFRKDAEHCHILIRDQWLGATVMIRLY